MTVVSGERLVVAIESVAAGGDGLARLPDGRVVFVEGGLPGEEVEVVLGDVRRDHAKGRAERILRPSPDRVEPRCPRQAEGCGGCGWAHVRPAAQLTLADDVVADALRRIAHLPNPPAGPASTGVENLRDRQVSPAGYRTTVTLAVAPDGSLGYHRRRDRRLVGAAGCLVAHPLIGAVIPAVRAPGWGTVTLRASVADGTVLAVVSPAEPEGTRTGGRRGRRPPTGRGRAGGRVDVPSGVTVVLPGEDAALFEEVAGRRWRVSSRSFFQSGPQAAELLASAVDGVLGPDGLTAGERLVDAYGGVGLLGGIVASRRGARLTCVEADPGAAADAVANLAGLDATVAALPVDRWQPDPADAVIADPARPGLGRPGVAAVAATEARRIVLVSCDPASFARDVDLLAGVGYRLVDHRVLGLFPDTTHLEVVSRFDRTGPR